jgi:hypothetical protein
MIGAQIVGGELVGGRLHYMYLPQGTTTPAIILQRGSMTGEHRTTWRTGFFRVNVLAPTYLQAGDIAKAIRRKLDGHRDDEIAYVAFDDEADIPSVPVEGESQPRIYGIRIDFRFGFNETPAPVGA